MKVNLPTIACADEFKGALGVWVQRIFLLWGRRFFCLELRSSKRAPDLVLF